MSAEAALPRALPRIRISALIIRDDAVALVKFRTAALGVTFDLPGGGLDPGESLRDGVRRECREEIGCDVTVGRLLLVAERFPESHTLDFIFACALADGQEPRMPEIPDEDQIDALWMPLETLAAGLLKPAMADLLIRRARGAGDDLLNVDIWTAA